MDHWIGIAIVVLPVLLIAAAILKRAVWWFLLALTAVGLGYLEFTGATREIGNAVLTEVNEVFPTGFGPEPGSKTLPASAPADGAAGE